MSATDKANTAGLKAVAKLADHLRPFEHHTVGSLRIDMNEVRNVIAACDFAASRIAELEAEVQRWHEAHDIAHEQAVSNGASAQAAEARADRLAEVRGDLNERAKSCFSLLPGCGDQIASARIHGKATAYLHAAELISAALQQETQP